MLMELGDTLRFQNRLLEGLPEGAVPLGQNGWLLLQGHLLIRSDGQAKFLEGKAAAETVASRLRHSGHELDDLSELLSVLNGSFTIIIVDRLDTREPRAILCSDLGGTRPLFYSARQQDLIVSSRPGTVALKSNADFDLQTALCLVTLGFIPGNQTLAVGVEQLKPAEIITFKRGGIHWKRSVHRYWSPRVLEDELADESHYRVKLAALLSDWANDWAAAAESELATLPATAKVAVPMDATLESRLLLALLAQRIPNRLVAVTTGEARSEDSLAGRDVAKALAVEHRHLEIHGGWLNGEMRDQLAHTMGFTTRMTLGVHALAMSSAFGAHQREQRDDVALIFSPIGGDELSGYHLTENIAGLRSASEITDRALASYLHSFSADELKPLLLEENQSLAGEPKGRLLKSCVETGGRDALNIVQTWIMREFVHRKQLPQMEFLRRRTFAALPYFDQRYMDFFNNVPGQFLCRQRLLRGTALEMFTGKLASLAKIPLREQQDLRNIDQLAPQQSGIIRLFKIISPFSINKRQTVPEFVNLWKRDEVLRDSLWEELEDDKVIARLFNHRALLDYLRIHIGKDETLTAQGLWGILTLKRVGAALEAIEEEATDH